MTLDREILLSNLRNRAIDDQTYSRIETFYPLAKICPTCAGKEKYNLDGLTFECDCEIQRILQRHYFASNIGREYHDICLHHFEGPDREGIVPVVLEYIEKFEDNFHFGLGLTFSGTVGTGKTFAMNCVLKELVKQGRNVYFVSFEELINIWGRSYHDNEARLLLEKRLKTAEVLGLDELRTDARNAGGFLANGLDSVIRHRTSNLLPTLVTTNMSKDQEKKEFTKVFSLLAAKNNRVETHGHDRRMAEVRRRNFELKQLGERRPVC
jgi:DNA replication protein DnaC